MPDDAAILTLAQWFSPAFPVGAFSYSHGLEQAIEAGDVRGRAELESWIRDVLEDGSGRADALFMAAAFSADGAAALDRIERTCRAFAPARERLAETTLQGAAFCRAVSDVWGISIDKLCYPVAAGRAARLLSLPPVLTCAMYLHAFAGNLVSVGMRLIPLGQTDGHALIDALATPCRRIAADTAHGDLSELTGTAFLSDIAAMRHETRYSRTFRT